MRYKSTRGGVSGLSFEDAVMMGLSSDGGLLIPEKIPLFKVGTINTKKGGGFMDKLVEEFILYVYKNPNEDIERVLNRYVRSLSEEDRKSLTGMSPLLLESGRAACEAEACMRELIIKEARDYYNLE